MQQENLLVKRYHWRNTGEPAGRRRRCIRRREFHMSGRELIASHPASVTIVV